MLPFGQRLGGFGLRLAVGAPQSGTGLQALGDRGSDHPSQQRGRADRVVVAWDWVVDLVGVAVRVKDRDDRDAQFAGLTDGNVLFVRVDDQIADGTLAMSRMPPRLRSSLFFSRVNPKISFLVRPSKPPVCSIASSS